MVLLTHTNIAYALRYILHLNPSHSKKVNISEAAATAAKVGNIEMRWFDGKPPPSLENQQLFADPKLIKISTEKFYAEQTDFRNQTINTSTRTFE